MTITPVDLALAAGETVRVQGGNQLFLYSLTGPSSLGIVFYHPNGQRMGPEGEFPVGVRYGPGHPRPDGSLFWQWAEVTNNSASVATAKVFIAESIVDMSAVSPNVTVASGSVDADVFTGNRNGAWASAETGPNAAAYTDALDFHATLSANNVQASGGCLVLEVLAESGGGSEYPKAVLLDEIIPRSDQNGWKVRAYGLRSISFPAGSATAIGSFMSEQGGEDDVWPASAGSAARKWLRVSTASSEPTGNNSTLVHFGSANEIYRHEFSRPLVCERVGSSSYGGRYIVLQNTAGVAAKMEITIRGRVIPS